MEVAAGYAELAEGVGERSIRLASEVDGEGVVNILIERGMVAGRGVDTPNALASFANLWGGKGL